MTTTPIGATPRGFAIYDEFEDDHGTRVTVQESSSADVDGVWVFVLDGDHAKPDVASGGTIYPALHLDPEQASRLRDALDAHLARIEQEDDDE